MFKLRIIILWIFTIGLLHKNSAQTTLYQNTFKNVFNSISVPNNGSTREFLPVSPQAGSLGIFGQIPVGHYSGAAEINIPIYEIKYKELAVPINIKYHTSGIKPDLFPGIVGLGWSLESGGMISRVINGAPDFGKTLPNEDMQLNGPSIRELNDWYSTPQLNNILKYDIKFEDPAIDPDEFYLNINGKTGRFYINPDSTLSMQTTNAGIWHIKIEVGDLSGSFLPLAQSIEKKPGYKPYSNYITLHSTIKGFTLIDEKGVKYHFGGSLKSIEFSRPGFNEVVNYKQDFSDCFIQPMSWMLTSIESPNGYKIDFSYEQETIITSVRFFDFAVAKIRNSTYSLIDYNFPDGYKSTLINGCHLSKIDFPNGYIIFLSSTASEQLDYPPIINQNLYQYINYNHFNSFIWYTDVAWANTSKEINKIDTNKEEVRNRFFPFKLDKLSIFDYNNTLVKNITFNYTNDRMTRLKLCSVNFGDTDTNYKYSFYYNTKSLPEYFSNMTDDYGYYNGKKMFDEASDEDKGNNYYPFILNRPQYFEQKKEPDFEKSKSEILTKITYPTGGYTEFEYEPHEFGSYLDQVSQKIIENQNGNLLTAGVRIKAIKNYDNNKILLNEKYYHYTTNYTNNGTRSSGILVYKPQFEERYSNIYMHYGENYINTTPIVIQNYLRFSSNPIFPMTFSKGIHATYTEVTEEDPKNGYTVFKFKNYNNGYIDLKPINALSNKISYDPYGNEELKIYKDNYNQSLNIERGQLLSEEVYSQDKHLKKKILYKYNDEKTRFKEGVRYIHFAPNSLNILNQCKSYNISAGLHFTYFPYLKEKKTVDYFNDSIITIENYSYTLNTRLKKSITSNNINGNNIKTEYVYPFENPSLLIYSEMTKRYMYDYPILKTSLFNNQIVKKILIEYKQVLSQKSNLRILPYKLSEEYADKSIHTKVIYEDYDLYSNPQTITDQYNKKTTLLWSPKGESVCAKIEGITFKEICDNIKKNDISIISDESYVMKTYIESILPKNDIMYLVSCYGYFPLIGLSSETSPQGLTTYYDYDSLGRLKNIYKYNANNLKKQLIKSYIYNYCK